MRQVIALLAVAASLVACAPANVAGNYSGNVTNGTSTCPGNWSTGNTSTVTFAVAQSGGNVTVNVQGVAGAGLALWTGSAAFSGTVAGNGISATLIGTTAQMTGNCRYTYRADLNGSLNGNTLDGTVTYRPDITAPPGSDCDAMRVTGCTITQTFNGLRPPPAGP
jgi:hypothetical protein